MSEDIARYFLLQLAEGMKEMRVHNLIHRDLKPQNLLLSDSTAQPLLKIADFGFARDLQPQGLAETLCGSPLYMAPEILRYHKYDAKADLWSVGTILFELLSGKPPFNGANHIQLLQNIERGDARLPPALAATLGPAVSSLLHGLLRRNPIERISFEEFFSHPFLVDGPRPLGLPALHLPVPPTSHAPSASQPADHAHPHRRAPSPLPAQQQQPPPPPPSGERAGQPARVDLPPHAAAAPAPHQGRQAGRGQAVWGAADQQQESHAGRRQQQQQQQEYPYSCRQEIGIAMQGSRSPSPHTIAAAAGVQHPPAAAPCGPAGAAATDPPGDDALDPEEYVVVSYHSLSPASSCAGPGQQQPQQQPQHGTMPILRALLQPSLSRQQAAAAAAAAAHTAPISPATPSGAGHPAASAPAQPGTGSHPSPRTVNDGRGGLAATAQIVRLPDHLDPAELLHRVILVLLEVIRTRVEAAAAAEDDHLLMGGPSWLRARWASRQGGGMAVAGARMKEAMGGTHRGGWVAMLCRESWTVAGGVGCRTRPGRRRRSCWRCSCTARGGWPLLKSPGGLIDAALLSTSADAAAGICGPQQGGDASVGACASPADLHRQSSLQHRPSHPLHQQHQQQRSLLMTHARASLALSDERMLSGSFQPLRDCSMQGRLVPSGSDMVYDSALRFGRSAAVDELLGAHRRGVEGYAKSADLLLFLLTEVPQVRTVQPSLDPADHAQLYKYYAAVRMRQSYCMAELNAQHTR
ncbi:MAG: hypothetical protein WDW38_007573 [Sanguina aurantia]